MYGSFLSNLEVRSIRNIFSLNLIQSIFLKYYLIFFGYPDLASNERKEILDRHISSKKDLRILDLGSGSGIGSLYLAFKYNYDVKGVEIEKQRVEKSNLIAKNLKLKARFLQADIEKIIPFKDKFDLIILSEVLQYVDEDKKLLVKCSKILNTKGKLLLFVPFNYGSDRLKKQIKRQYKFERKQKRDGYNENIIKDLMKCINMDINFIGYYRYPFTVFSTNIQEYFYLNDMLILNLITHPILYYISKIDQLLKTIFSPKGMFVIARKQP